MKALQASHSEKLLFLLLTLLNLLPLFPDLFFTTLDGPAHLYNARLIGDLALSHGSQASEFFRFNPDNLTNFTGHLFLLALLQVFSAGTAEKILIAAILISFPYAFRFVVRRMQPSHPILTWLVFPLSWSSMLFHGFFNFLIGTVFALFALGLWIQPEQKYKRSALGWIFLLLLLAALSHIFAFAVGCFLCGLWTIWRMSSGTREKGARFPRLSYAQGLRNLLALGLTALPGLFILTHYLWFGNHGNQTGETVSIGTSLNDIRIFKSAIAYTDSEQMYTAKWFYLLVLAGGVALWMRWIMRKRDALKRKASALKSGLFQYSDFLLISSLLFLLLFIISDQLTDRQMYLQDRLIFFAFILLTGWIALQQYPRWFTGILVFLALFVSTALMLNRWPHMRSNAVMAQEAYLMASKLEPRSVIYPVSFSSNWQHAHVSNYMAVDHELIVLSNYECSQGYFPLVYQKEKGLQVAALNSWLVGSDYSAFMHDPPYDYLVTFSEIDALDRVAYIRFRLMLNRCYKLHMESPRGWLRVYKARS